MTTSCTFCPQLLNQAGLGPSPLLCGAGRTQVYGASVGECSLFHADAASFDAQIASWTPPTVDGNGTIINIDPFPGCRDVLEVFFCAQQQVHVPDEDDPTVKGPISHCSSYRRPLNGNGRCRAYCPPIRDHCPTAAFDYCETFCRTANADVGSGYCEIVEITGLNDAHWNADTLDMMNLYRMVAEAGQPLLKEGRPFYRSIPALRPPGSDRATRLDYYLYATRLRGFTEWLLDTNDLAEDGAAGYVSDGNLAPYLVNSDWTIWSPERQEWAAQPVRVKCSDGTRSAAPLSSRPTSAGRTWATAVATVAATAVLWRREQRALRGA